MSTEKDGDEAIRTRVHEKAMQHFAFEVNPIVLMYTTLFFESCDVTPRATDQGDVT